MTETKRDELCESLMVVEQYLLEAEFDDAAFAVTAARREIARLSAGLSLIHEVGSIYGAGWCVAQARGFLLDLDFDGYPETGRPETEPGRPDTPPTPIPRQQEAEG